MKKHFLLVFTTVLISSSLCFGFWPPTTLASNINWVQYSANEMPVDRIINYPLSAAVPLLDTMGNAGPPLEFQVMESVLSMEEVNSNKLPRYIHECINKKLKYPPFAPELSNREMVMVALRFDDEGRLWIKDSNYSNLRLKEYIYNVLNGTRLCNGMVSTTMDYYLRFDFIRK